MREFDLLVLTPAPFGPRPYYRRQLSIWRRRLMLQPVSPYGGHPGVTRSLVEGLRGQSRLRWAYITRYRGQTTKVLHVVADPTYVEIGIQAKRNGLCDRLIVGPNITVRPGEHDRVQTRPEVDCVIVPSDSVVRIYLADEPSLDGRTASWPAGVDSTYWQTERSDRSSVLVYTKAGRDEDGAHLIGLLTKLGFPAFGISYGSYRLREFRDALAQSCAMVVVAGPESQGIAMFEAWAMNVPTFVNSYAREMMSPSPYLSAATGAFWNEPEELIALVRSAGSYRPRDWILQHGTDEISARILLTIAGLAAPGEEVLNAPSAAMPPPPRAL